MLRLLWARWAYGSETHVQAEGARQDWCESWAYKSGTGACTEQWAYSSGTNAFAEGSPFKTYWAYTSGTDSYPERTGQKLMRARSPKTKLTGFYFSPKVTNPERLYCVKIMKIRAIENLTLGHLSVGCHLTTTLQFILFPRYEFQW